MQKLFYKGDFQIKLSKLKEYLFDHMSLKGDNVILRENLKVGIRSYQKNEKVSFRGEFHKIVKIKRLHGRKGDDV